MTIKILRLSSWDQSAGIAIEQAYYEAQSLHHDFVGSEHLLLALIDSKKEASAALRAVGVEREAFLRALIFLVGRDAGKTPQIIQTKRFERILKTAQKEAWEIGDRVDANYLLFAILLEEKATANQLLQDIGTDRWTVMRSLQTWVQKR